MGLGSMGGSTQMLFGGSGGQDFFERVTWVLGGLFIFGSLGLAILKSKEIRSSKFIGSKVAQKKTPKQNKKQSLPLSNHATTKK